MCWRSVRIAPRSAHRSVVHRWAMHFPPLRANAPQTLCRIACAMATHEGTGLLAHGGEGGAVEEGHDGPQKNFPPCFPLSANFIAISASG